MLGLRTFVLERRADLGGREHVFTGMAAISPDFVLAVGRGGVSVEDGVGFGQAEPAHVGDGGERLLFVDYFPVN